MRIRHRRGSPYEKTMKKIVQTCAVTSTVLLVRRRLHNFSVKTRFFSFPLNPLR